MALQAGTDTRPDVEGSAVGYSQRQIPAPHRLTPSRQAQPGRFTQARSWRLVRLESLQDIFSSNGLDQRSGLCKVEAKYAEDHLHGGYITAYLHSLQSQASCRLRERAIRSNRPTQFQCQLPLVTAPGSGGQIKSQFVFETAEPGCLLRAVHLVNGLCSFSTATPRKRRAAGAWFIPTLHNSVLNSPTDHKQKQSCRRAEREM